MSGNPLSKYADELKEFTNIGVEQVDNLNSKYFKLGGFIVDIKRLYDKKNNPWAICQLECYNGRSIDLFLFNDQYIKYRHFLEEDKLIYIEAEPSKQQNGNAFKLIVQHAFLFHCN